MAPESSSLPSRPSLSASSKIAIRTPATARKAREECKPQLEKLVCVECSVGGETGLEIGRTKHGTLAMRRDDGEADGPCADLFFYQTSRSMPRACAYLKVPNDVSHRDVLDGTVGSIGSPSAFAVGMLRKNDPRSDHAMRAWPELRARRRRSGATRDASSCKTAGWLASTTTATSSQRWCSPMP